MSLDNKQKYEIALVGAGINPRLHLTPEARNIIGEYEQIYHLTADHKAILDASNGNCEDLTPLYTQVRNSKVYEMIARKIIDSAEHGRVAFVTYGHPMVLVDTNQMILAEARRKNIQVRVVSGISSIDLMLEYLSLDVGLAGLQIFEVNQMVALQHYPIPTVSCIIMQIGAFGATALTIERKNHPRRFERLRDFLLHSYVPEHPAILMTCSFKPDMESLVYQISIGEIDQAYECIHTGMSLYIPPAQPKDLNKSFLNSLSKPKFVWREEDK